MSASDQPEIIFGRLMKLFSRICCLTAGRWVRTRARDARPELLYWRLPSYRRFLVRTKARLCAGMSHVLGGGGGGRASQRSDLLTRLRPEPTLTCRKAPCACDWWSLTFSAAVARQPAYPGGRRSAVLLQLMEFRPRQLLGYQVSGEGRL